MKTIPTRSTNDQNEQIVIVMLTEPMIGLSNRKMGMPNKTMMMTTMMASVSACGRLSNVTNR